MAPVLTTGSVSVRKRAGGVFFFSRFYRRIGNPSKEEIFHEDEDLVELARGFEGIVIVDEAYHEFSRHSVVPLLKVLPNLIVLRTFSKAMAMAGLRVGYLLASPELTREVHKATLPYNLNFVSSTVARVACERYDTLLKPLVDRLIDERDRILPKIRHIAGLDPVDSHANFFLVRTAL